MRRNVIVLLLVATLLVVMTAFSQGSEARKDAAMSTLEAVNVVRQVNTMELNFRNRHGQYANVDQLGSTRAEGGTKLNDLKGQNLPGYSLSVVTSFDGQHYWVSLKASDTNKKSFFSDDAGLIYEASPIR